MKRFALLFIFIVFQGCSLLENEKCPAYPAASLKWMPYNRGQTLSFSDGSGSFQLKVDHVDISKSHRVFKDFYGLYNCSPQALAEISSPATYPKITAWSSIACVDCTTTSNLSSLVHYSFYINEASQLDSHFYVALNGDNLYIDRAYVGEHYKAEILSKHHNGFKEYYKVICIENDTIHYAPMEIYKLYIAESVGVIEYVRRKQNQSVYLIDN